MAIINRAARVLVLAAVTAAVTGLTAGPVWAVAATWTVKPGGAITAKSGMVTLTDTTTGGLGGVCASSTATGSLKAGGGLSGTGIGTLASLTFTACNSGGIAFTLTASHFPWHLNAVSFNSATGVTTGTLTGMHAVLSSSTVPCSAVLDGTSATADNGKVKVTYRNSTGKLTVRTTGGNLVFYNSTCPGIHSGDQAALSASYAVTPGQTITSP